MKSKKILYRIFFIMILSLFFSYIFISENKIQAAGSNSEHIEKYEVNINILENSLLEIEEKIDYDFTNFAYDKHGIIRKIPINYKARGGNYNLRLTDLKITDENGKKIKYSREFSFDETVLKIGDAEKTVKGIKHYIISYKINRAVNFFDSHDEVYWNAIGSESNVPIKKAKVNIFYPDELKKENIDYECFYGKTNQDKKCQYEKFEDGSLIFEQNDLQVYEGVTVVIGIPKGILIQPSFWQEAMFFIRDNWMIVFPLIFILGIIILWFKKGRDPKGRGTIIAEYEAPNKLTSAEVGTIIDESVDKNDLSSVIIDLAVKGYLRIERIVNKGFLGMEKEDYKFIKLKESDNLKIFEKTLFDGFFEGEKKEIKLSELKDKFASTYTKVKNQIYENVTKEGYFAKNPYKTRSLYLTIAGLILFVGIFLGIFLQNLWFGSGMVLATVVVGIFGYFMPAKTLKGVHSQEKILGLKKYLSVAEKERLKFHNAPKKEPKQFEKLLPYAIALKVEEQWAKAFKDIYKENPDWYEDNENKVFNSILLMNSLNHFSRETNGVLTSTPSSKASSGSSGFSGGSVGGGFGGGSVGSW